MARHAAHAIIVGASLAGLTTAAALAGRFDRVTVVDRDSPPVDAQPRTGVPQGRHGHILLPSGLQGLATLLPGITTDLQAAGAHLIDVGEIRFHIAGDHLALDDTELKIVGATRPLLESVVRSRVRARPNVKVLDGHDVRGLVTDDDATRVTGLRVRPRDGDGERIVEGELVVDASGRGSRSPWWLMELGYAAPDEERFHVGVHYATRLFRRRPADLDGCRHVVAGVPPDGRRGGFAVAVEDHRCLVTLVGVLGERPPTDLDGFVAYARTLETGDLHVLADGAEPVSEPSTGAFPAYLRRRYERLRLPAGFVAVGDALCSFNPLYAQGMSMAVREASLLGEILDRHGTERIGTVFFRQATPMIDAAWAMSTSADLGHPELDGPRPVQWRLLNRYFGRLLRTGHHDPVVANTYLRVISMVAPIQQILHPAIAWRVLTRHRAETRHRTPQRQDITI